MSLKVLDGVSLMSQTTALLSFCMCVCVALRPLHMLKHARAALSSGLITHTLIVSDDEGREVSFFYVIQRDEEEEDPWCHPAIFITTN